ncbi:MAG: GTPase [Patescibacteria group bacterium]|jgi:GTP-binding protein|nr:GTPase [Patescibacteria group bacterium]
MALVDELKIYAKAGDGGDGVVRWLREKSKPWSGPAGGNGGKGGDVYLKGVRDASILADYVHDTNFKAENGEAGAKNSREGANGEDLYIKVPVGSLVTNLDTGEQYDVDEDGKEILILKGARGGLGNEHFKSSTNTTPYESTPGKHGQDGNFFIELRLFADLGLVGYPNAGKSTFLNSVTNAKSKIGAYPFTTLDPHLGVLEEFVIADIPGIIEGASEGKGLGLKFLKHIKRTKAILHLVSFDRTDDENGQEMSMMEKYKNIRKELEGYDEELGEKDEIILLTKTDTVDEKTVKEEKKKFEKLKKPVLVMSAYDDESVKNAKDEIVKILRNRK